MKKITWLREETTSVRLDPREPKVAVKKGDVLDVEDKRADELLRYSKDFKLVTGDVKAPAVAKVAVEAPVEAKPIKKAKKV